MTNAPLRKQTALETAEHYFASKYRNLGFFSAGTTIKTCRKEGTTEMTEGLLEWADKVYVMERRHLEHNQKYTGSKYYAKTEILSITDIYKYYNTELIGF